ncbi:MAG: FecR domain-containing protein [Sphingobium sp.]
MVCAPARGRADEDLKAGFADWLRADPLHAEAWQSMCGTMDAVHRAPPELRSYTMPAPARRRGWFRRAGAVAGGRKRRARVAGAAIAAAGAFALALPSVSLRLRADHLTGAARIEQVRLADGSTVQLGPDSALAIDYGGGKRTVRLLSGQAMFDVVPDSNRPFIVAAGEVTTTVLGTSFDVRMIGEGTSVAVSRGRVRVEDAGARPATVHDLRAGDWLGIDAAHRARTGRTPPQLVGAWLRGDVLAENRSIADVIDEIRPWYAGRIIVTDTRLAARPVTGIYRLDDPEKALAMIIQPYGGRFLILTERHIRGPRLDAAKRLLPLRDAPLDATIAEQAVRLVSDGRGVTLGVLAGLLPASRQASLAVIWRMIARGLLRVDMNDPLGPDSRIALT